MVLKDCKIMFNTIQGVFYSGDIVTGTVTFEFKHSNVLKELSFKVKGTSKASWTRPMPTIPYIKIYSEKLEVLKIDLNLFQDINKSTSFSKFMSVPFHFALPHKIPSSYQDSISKTYYRIIIKAITVCKRRHKRVFPFVVVSYLNLNHFEHISYNVQYLYEVTKCFDKSKQFHLKIKTYKGVGSNQRNIPFEVYITNERKIKVSKITISLMQKMDYTVISGYYNSEKKIHEVTMKDLKNQNETIRFSIDIPAVIPTTINLERTLVNISYEYKITVCFRFHLSINMEVPVVIGSTPVIFTNQNVNL